MRWIRCFERFSDTSPNQKLELLHRNTADDILSSLLLMTEEKKVYKTVRDKLEAHFVKNEMSYMSV